MLDMIVDRLSRCLQFGQRIGSREALVVRPSGEDRLVVVRSGCC
jgi:hypothetical protein